MDTKDKLKQKKLFQYNAGKRYSATVSSTGFSGSILGAFFDGKPVFYYIYVPRMLRDPAIRFGIRMLVSQFTQAKWTIKAANKEVYEYVDMTVGKFWKKIMPNIVRRYLAWGYAPAVLNFKANDSIVKLKSGIAVNPPDATARIFSRGKKEGEFAGFDLQSGGGGDFSSSNSEHMGSNFIGSPHAFWFAGAEERERFYDDSRLVGPFEAWLEKNTRNGALENRKLWYRKCAFTPGILYYPPGVDTEDPNINNRDVALQMAEAFGTGAIPVLPDLRIPGDDAKQPMWRWEFPNSSRDNSNFEEYCKTLDTEIMKGLGIPPEVIEAADTGSGWSGRSIPRDALFNMTDENIGQLIDSMDQQFLRDMVQYTFGDKGKFEIENIPLAESVRMQEQNPQSAVMGAGGGNPLEALAGAMGAGGQEEGGVATAEGEDQFDVEISDADGLVPYVGRRGGKGKKDPRTGRVYYMSHETGQPVGCLLIPIPECNAKKFVDFAKSIPENYLAEDGIETEPHVTVKYGLHEMFEDPIFSVTEKLGSLSYKPGKLAMFSGDKHDVLYVSCENPTDFKMWHDSLNHLKSTKTHEEYVPHITLAYLKKGKVNEYLDRMDFTGNPIDLEKVVYHSPDGQVFEQYIWPSEAELASIMGEPVLMADAPRGRNARRVESGQYEEERGHGWNIGGPQANPGWKQRFDQVDDEGRSEPAKLSATPPKPADEQDVQGTTKPPVPQPQSTTQQTSQKQEQPATQQSQQPTQRQPKNVIPWDDTTPKPPIQNQPQQPKPQPTPKQKLPVAPRLPKEDNQRFERQANELRTKVPSVVAQKFNGVEVDPEELESGIDKILTIFDNLQRSGKELRPVRMRLTINGEKRFVKITPKGAKPQTPIDNRTAEELPIARPKLPVAKPRTTNQVETVEQLTGDSNGMQSPKTATRLKKSRDEEMDILRRKVEKGIATNDERAEFLRMVNQDDITEGESLFHNTQDADDVQGESTDVPFAKPELPISKPRQVPVTQAIGQSETLKDQQNIEDSISNFERKIRQIIDDGIVKLNGDIVDEMAERYGVSKRDALRKYREITGRLKSEESENAEQTQNIQQDGGFAVKKNLRQETVSPINSIEDVQKYSQVYLDPREFLGLPEGPLTSDVLNQRVLDLYDGLRPYQVRYPDEVNDAMDKISQAMTEVQDSMSNSADETEDSSVEQEQSAEQTDENVDQDQTPSPTEPESEPEISPTEKPIGEKNQVQRKVSSRQLQKFLRQVKSLISENPEDVNNMDPQQIQVDPSRFQYKVSGIGSGGIGSELKDARKWKPEFGGVILVWKDPKDGKTYVVNGHHRLDLAKRKGVNIINARYIQADNESDARAIGALANIAEGRGTAIDAAKFMRDTGRGIDDLREFGVSSSGLVARNAITLSKLDPSIFQKVVTGSLPESVAINIAESVENPVMQRQLLELVDREGGDLTQGQIRQLGNMIQAAGTTKTSSASLFGDIEEEESNFIEAAKIADYVRREIGNIIRRYQPVSDEKRAQEIKGEGNVLNVEANREQLENAKKLASVFDRQIKYQGPLTQQIGELASELKQATTKRKQDAVLQKAKLLIMDILMNEQDSSVFGESQSEVVPAQEEGNLFNQPEPEQSEELDKTNIQEQPSKTVAPTKPESTGKTLASKTKTVDVDKIKDIQEMRRLVTEIGIPKEVWSGKLLSQLKKLYKDKIAESSQSKTQDNQDQQQPEITSQSNNDAKLEEMKSRITALLDSDTHGTDEYRESVSKIIKEIGSYSKEKAILLAKKLTGMDLKTKPKAIEQIQLKLMHKTNQIDRQEA